MERTLNWGATQSEIRSVLPGDERVSNPSYVSTRAVTIGATPGDIWPWLAQLGYRRGGLYSYDWLDRLFGYLDGPSAEEILPEYQSIRSGDTIPLGRGPDWPVVEVVPERTLVVEPLQSAVTWAFVLVPIDKGSTRLVTRVRYRTEPTFRGRLMMAAMDLAAFVMTRKMLLGVKRRAEALARRVADRGNGRRPATHSGSPVSGASACIVFARKPCRSRGAHTTSSAPTTAT